MGNKRLAVVSMTSCCTHILFFSLLNQSGIGYIQRGFPIYNHHQLGMKLDPACDADLWLHMSSQCPSGRITCYTRQRRASLYIFVLLLWRFVYCNKVSLIHVILIPSFVIDRWMIFKGWSFLKGLVIPWWWKQHQYYSSSWSLRASRASNRHTVVLRSASASLQLK